MHFPEKSGLFRNGATGRHGSPKICFLRVRIPFPELPVPGQTPAERICGCVFFPKIPEIFRNGATGRHGSPKICFLRVRIPFPEFPAQCGFSDMQYACVAQRLCTRLLSGDYAGPNPAACTFPEKGTWDGSLYGGSVRPKPERERSDSFLSHWTLRGV